MSDESSIHDFDINLICDYFALQERQGPGSPEATRQALSFVPPLNSGSQVADIGCGSGGQTLELARNCPAQIVGLDLFPRFIELLNSSARENGLADRVRGQVADMNELPFEPGQLDLIWSEGAIYNIGFQNGLRQWRPFLREGGTLAVTEVSWLTDERPAEIQAYWEDAYPEIDTIAHKIAQMQQAGYRLQAAFVLPETCWTEHFYAPQAAAQATFLRQHPDDPAVAAFIETERKEAALYAKYKSYYGYVFYIGQKR